MAAAKTRKGSRRLGNEIAHQMIQEIEDRVAGCAVSAPFDDVRSELPLLGKIDPDDV